MSVWSEINTTLGIIVWPVVLMTGLIVFRGELRGLFGRLRKARGAGGELEFDAAAADRRIAAFNEKASEKVASGVKVLSKLGGDVIWVTPSERDARDRPDEVEDEGSDDLGETGDPVEGADAGEVGEPVDPVEGQDPDEDEPLGLMRDPDDQAARDAFEEIVQASAAAGWEVARSGRYAGRPVPVIEWEDGVPRISGWSGAKVEPRAVSWTAAEARGAVARLEDEIRRLTIEAESTPTVQRFNIVGNSPYDAKRKLISELKQRLSWLDPESPYAE